MVILYVRCTTRTTQREVITMNRYFSDISNWQKQQVNFQEYKNKGQHVLVGLKATEGMDYIDPTHAPRSEAAHVAGVWVLHYHFAHVGQNPEDNAARFWNVIGHHFAPKDFA